MSNCVQILIVLIFLTASTIHAKSAPIMSLSKTLHDFGDVFSGAQLEYEYVFKNIGKEPLKLLGINASCGCTVVDAPTGKAIAANKSSSIKIKFDTTDFEGLVSKSIVVMTNEKLRNSRILTFKANIAKRYIVTPPVINFSRVSYSTNPQRVVTIRPNQNGDLKVVKVSYPEKKFSVSQVQNLDGSLSLEVRLKQPLKTGFLREEIKIKTSNPLQRTLKIPVTANILGPIVVRQKSVELGSIKATTNVVREVTFDSKLAFEPHVQKLELYLNGTKLKNTQIVDSQFTRKLDDKKSWLLELSVKNTESVQGSLKGKIFVRTDITGQNDININLHGLLL